MQQDGQMSRQKDNFDSQIEHENNNNESDQHEQNKKSMNQNTNDNTIGDTSLIKLKNDDDDCKQEDEDKIILMQLIAQNQQQQDQHEQILEQINLNQGSQMSLSRMKSQPRESIHINQLQQQQSQLAFDSSIPASIASLARKRYISTELDQQINPNNNNISNFNDNKNIPVQLTKRQMNLAARAAALNQNGNYNDITENNNNNQIDNNINNKDNNIINNINNENETNQQQQQQQQDLFGINQQNQIRAPIGRGQKQHQSVLSSAQSLTVSRDFHIYFVLNDNSNTNNKSGSWSSQSNKSNSYEKEERDGMIKMINSEINEIVKVPIDDLLEDATVMDAIQSAICQINNFFFNQKINVRLIYDEKLYDLYLAKKNGEKKSFPALYPLEKMKKFANQNMVLIPHDAASAIIRPKETVNTSSPKKSTASQSNSQIKNNNNNSQIKNNNNYSESTTSTLNNNNTSNNNYIGKQREIIKEVSESMISNKSVDVNRPIKNNNDNNKNSIINNNNNTNNNQGGNSNSFINQRNPSSFIGTNPATKRSIQSTITAKQTKIGHEEKDTVGDVQVQTQQKTSSNFFSFICCVRNSSSRTQSNNNNNNNNNSSPNNNSSNNNNNNSSKKHTTVISS